MKKHTPKQAVRCELVGSQLAQVTGGEDPPGSTGPHKPTKPNVTP